jgi:2-polyprenyl-6-hydroxyphenyl methylase/3-demethylubiquinone-9 3-methyltransferase
MENAATNPARFEFGLNWTKFLSRVDEQSVDGARAHLRQMLGTDSLEGKRFLDAGSGSGLTSLAARAMGARVRSFDLDPHSVSCTEEMRRRFRPDDPDWEISSGSVLDRDFIQSLGTFDVVCSWGVLHHTGALKQAMANIIEPVAPGGQLLIALYNDQGLTSRYWYKVKELYNSSPLWRSVVIASHAPYLLGGRAAVRAATGRLSLERGMSLWHDMLDWLGGFPFEVARPDEVVDFYGERGFTLEKLKTCGGRHGCNEFTLRAETRQAR